MDVVISINSHTIRLTSERWLHISIGHPEVSAYYYEILECVQKPDYIYEGNKLEL